MKADIICCYCVSKGSGKTRNDGNGNGNENGSGNGNGNANSLACSAVVVRSTVVARSTGALEVPVYFEFCYRSV